MPIGFAATAPTTNLKNVVSRSLTLQNMRVRHNAPIGIGTNVVYTIVKNGSTTALTVTLADNAADGTNLSDTVSLAAGDDFYLQVTTLVAALNVYPSVDVEYV